MARTARVRLSRRRLARPQLRRRLPGGDRAPCDAHAYKFNVMASLPSISVFAWRDFLACQAGASPRVRSPPLAPLTSSSPRKSHPRTEGRALRPSHFVGGHPPRSTRPARAPTVPSQSHSLHSRRARRVAATARAAAPSTPIARTRPAARSTSRRSLCAQTATRPASTPRPAAPARQRQSRTRVTRSQKTTAHPPQTLPSSHDSPPRRASARVSRARISRRLRVSARAGLFVGAGERASASPQCTRRRRASSQRPAPAGGGAPRRRWPRSPRAVSTT
jgi:hypothetical protein